VTLLLSFSINFEAHDDGLDIPPLPAGIQKRLADIETLNGLQERNVAIESILYLADQVKKKSRKVK